MNNEEQKKVQNAIESPEVEKIYFNGFSVGIGPGDILITLFKNGQPVTVLNTSYTVAKTLAEKLSVTIQLLEKQTQRDIMTSEYIDQKLKEQGSN